METQKNENKQKRQQRTVWKFDTLWEHPLGKGEATCHSSWLYSFMLVIVTYRSYT